MTPVSRWVSRRVPAALRVPALALIYFGMIAAVAFSDDTGVKQIIYVDIRGK